MSDSETHDEPVAKKTKSNLDRLLSDNLNTFISKGNSTVYKAMENAITASYLLVLNEPAEETGETQIKLYGILFLDHWRGYDAVQIKYDALDDSFVIPVRAKKDSTDIIPDDVVHERVNNWSTVRLSCVRAAQTLPKRFDIVEIVNMYRSRIKDTTFCNFQSFNVVTNPSEIIELCINDKTKSVSVTKDDIHTRKLITTNEIIMGVYLMLAKKGRVNLKLFHPQFVEFLKLKENGIVYRKTGATKIGVQIEEFKKSHPEIDVYPKVFDNIGLLTNDSAFSTHKDSDPLMFKSHTSIDTFKDFSAMDSKTKQLPPFMVGTTEKSPIMHLSTVFSFVETSSTDDETEEYCVKNMTVKTCFFGDSFASCYPVKNLKAIRMMFMTNGLPVFYAPVKTNVASTQEVGLNIQANVATIHALVKGKVIWDMKKYIRNIGTLLSEPASVLKMVLKLLVKENPKNKEVLTSLVKDLKVPTEDDIFVKLDKKSPKINICDMLEKIANEQNYAALYPLYRDDVMDDICSFHSDILNLTDMNCNMLSWFKYWHNQYEEGLSPDVYVVYYNLDGDDVSPLLPPFENSETGCMEYQVLELLDNEFDIKRNAFYQIFTIKK